ncbi:putative superfamily III holin-X [Roseiarcus fermentans]|uniref:Putative superfamily III holin-X n=1 Tax=Roseiarcus fermentans TaxID=1473586 RepID=A0A366F069_9HYPH|nr:phage holin family protein [Roseiarcus fermentans]RBP07360.1 putative superfamily III holin-X [Roseiarcus fermentans]
MMIETVIAFIREQASASLRRAAGPAALALIAALFVVFAVAGLFAALFFWLEPAHGAVVAALLCAVAAMGIALVCALPIVFRPRRPPPQPTEGALPQILMLLTKASSSLTPRQMIVTAAVVGFALFLSARGAARK